MMIALHVRADEACLDGFAHHLVTRELTILAKLNVSFGIVGLLANHNFRPIDRHHFAMRCFPRLLGGPRQSNTRGGES